jgi:hypothetical protein
MAAKFNQTTPPPAASALATLVPEPATISLMALVGCFIRRRRGEHL